MLKNLNIKTKVDLFSMPLELVALTLFYPFFLINFQIKNNYKFELLERFLKTEVDKALRLAKKVGLKNLVK